MCGRTCFLANFNIKLKIKIVIIIDIPKLLLIIISNLKDSHLSVTRPLVFNGLLNFSLRIDIVNLT